MVSLGCRIGTMSSAGLAGSQRSILRSTSISFPADAVYLVILQMTCPDAVAESPKSTATERNRAHTRQKSPLPLTGAHSHAPTYLCVIWSRPGIVAALVTPMERPSPNLSFSPCAKITSAAAVRLVCTGASWLWPRHLASSRPDSVIAPGLLPNPDGPQRPLSDTAEWRLRDSA